MGLLCLHTENQGCYTKRLIAWCQNFGLLSCYALFFSMCTIFKLGFRVPYHTSYMNVVTTATNLVGVCPCRSKWSSSLVPIITINLTSEKFKFSKISQQESKRSAIKCNFRQASFSLARSSSPLPQFTSSLIGQAQYVLVCRQ